jgi:hypothetical protein
MEAQRRATSAYPDPEHMPKGWIQIDPARLGSRPGDPVYCGIALKPDPMNGAMVHLYQESDAGPFILQYTYLSSEAAATKVMDRFVAEVPGCIARGTDPDGQVFPAKDAPTMGDAAVSMSFLPTGSVPSQVTVFRTGRALVAVVGWNPAGLPPTEALRTMAAGVQAKLSATR